WPATNRGDPFCRSRWRTAMSDPFARPAVTSADLTERDDLRSRLAAIVDSSDDAIISKDLNGGIATWNRAAARLLGYSDEEAIGQPITMIIPPELQGEEA